MRILVVDDDRDLAELLGRRLVLEGHDVDVCTDGWTALEMARLVHPDAVLTDLAMPGIDGWQLASRLRESLRSEVPLIVAISAYQTGDDYGRSRSAGIDFHLAKPRYFDELRRILLRYAAARQSSGTPDDHAPEHDAPSTDTHDNSEPQGAW
ncbi:MAG TPA: response regulator [Pirellulales bacterium]|nr:response regulator [Pirellulales bacterium]